MMLCDNCGYESEQNPCEDCSTVCENCMAYVLIDDCQSVNDDEIWCDRCMIDATQCDRCNNHYADSLIRYVEDIPFCEYCFDRVEAYPCEGCGGTFFLDNMTFCENCEVDTCESCIHEHGPIHDYGYKPRPIFQGDGPLYMGVELEVDDTNYNCNKFDLVNELNALDTYEEEFYLKEDSSLNDGVEIVTHPATLDYHLNTFPWNDVLVRVKQSGFRSHDAGTCGLHVHINREALGTKRYKQDYNLSKLIILFWKHWDYLTQFSRRKDSELYHWAKPNYTEDTLSKGALDAAKKKDRYSAINTGNRSTIEFRLFRGTLRKETLFATLQLVQSLINYVTTHTITECFNSAWMDIIDTQYTELTNYTAKRGINPKQARLF